jgi:hypothetical protein
MNPKQAALIRLAEDQGWGIVKRELSPEQIIDGEDPWYVNIGGEREMPLAHPWKIHLRIYRDTTDSEERYNSLVAAHHFLWPQYKETWTEWDERTFRAHCEGYTPVVLAGGAGIGKSHRLARIGNLFFLSDPKKNAVLVASTSLDSLESRIWGYVVKLMAEAQRNFSLPILMLRAKPPKVVHAQATDRIHGMFAIPIKRGDDETTLSSVIGRHPDKKMMVMLDEGTDMPHAAMKAVPNWEKAVDFFQLWIAGNSCDKGDLHGSCATPRVGWDKIDWRRDNSWPTVYQRGVCLYFNPYKSPAITEKDEQKRAKLKKFLIDTTGIEQAIEDYGTESPSFYRFCLGFWAPDNIAATIATRKFLDEQQVRKIAEWSGLSEILIIAGLDPAFSIGTKGCLLRFAVLGWSAQGRRMLDFRREELMRRIEVRVVDERSSERQMAEQVLMYLREMGCPLSSCAIDCSGQGRVLGDLIHSISGEPQGMIKVSSVGHIAGGLTTKDDRERAGIILATPTDLWFNFREFVDNGQIAGLDEIAFQQISTRTIIEKNGKQKIETKPDYIARMHSQHPTLARSPDEADTVMLCVKAAMIRHGFFAGQTEAPTRVYVNDFWTQKEHGRIAEARHRAEVVEPPRPRLVPNFSGKLEDMVGQRRGRR